MVELDMPNRTTRDYDGPAVAPRIQAALDAALQDEADLDLEGRLVDCFCFLCPRHFLLGAYSITLVHTSHLFVDT